MKRCSRCGKVLPDAEFNARTASKDGLAHYCRRCQREHSRRYQSVFSVRKRADRNARKRLAEMMEVAKEDHATVYIPGEGDVVIELPKMDGLS